jgi:alpha-L-fucosidase 2
MGRHVITLAFGGEARQTVRQDQRKAMMDRRRKMPKRAGITRRDALSATTGLAASLALPGALHAAVPAPSGKMLWYRQPATQWVEALPVGNGRIGAMIFGGTAHERIQLNEATLWSGGPYNPVNPDAREALPEVRRLIFAGRFAEAQALANAKVMARPLSQMAYQPIGDLTIDMPGVDAVAMQDYRRELDLDSAVATTTFQVRGVRFRREVIASAIDQVIAIRISADKAGAVDLDIALSSAQSATASAIGDTLIVAGKGPADHDVAGALRFEAQAKVHAESGKLAVQGGHIAARGADAVTILVAMATSYKTFDDVSGDPAAIVRGQIARANGRPFARIAADASAEHRRLFRRVDLDLGRTAAADRRAYPYERKHERSVARRTLFPLWPLSADRIVAVGWAAGEPARAVE